MRVKNCRSFTQLYYQFSAKRMSLQMPSRCMTGHFEREDLARKRSILNAGRTKAEQTGEHAHERLFGLTHHSARTLQRTSAEYFAPLCLNTSQRLLSWTRSSTPTRWRLVIVACTAISPLYKLIWPLHGRIWGNWAESVSTLLLFVPLATREQKWRRRFAGISSFPTRVHSSKSAKRWQS